MKVVIIGATGFVGSALLKELTNRGHLVTAIARNVEGRTMPSVTWVAQDIRNTDRLVPVLTGHDVVISAYNAGWSNPNLYEDFLNGSRSIQEAVTQAGVRRFIVIGGAGSLYTNDGQQIVDTPDFPETIRPGARAARDYLNVLKEEKQLDWVFFSPAIEMHPGVTIGRTGRYRLGKDYPVVDENGRSVLSVEDVAVVIADEVEKPGHHRERFTAAY